MQGALAIPGKHGKSTWPFQPVSPGNRVCPQARGDSVCQVTQASLEPSNKFSYSNNPAPATHPGLFHLSRESPQVHISPPSPDLCPLQGSKLDSRSPPHTSHSSSSPACLPGSLGWGNSWREGRLEAQKPPWLWGWDAPGHHQHHGMHQGCWGCAQGTEKVTAGTELPSAHRAQTFCGCPREPGDMEKWGKRAMEGPCSSFLTLTVWDGVRSSGECRWREGEVQENLS